MTDEGSDDTIRYTGGCACGNVRYEYDSEPQFSFHCHCRQCQQATGGGHASIFIALATNLSVKGVLTFDERGSDGGNTVTQRLLREMRQPWDRSDPALED